MSTYTRLVYQLVFGSKGYTAFLTPENQDFLFSYIAGILMNKQCHPYIVGGYRNHLHIIFDLHPSLPLSDLVRDIKKSSSAVLKDKKCQYPAFPGWQVGYGAFTYSDDALKTLINYVRNQNLHHKKKSFKEELVEFCIDQGVPYNEKHLLI